MISNPLTMDPARLQAAKQAYDEDLRRYETQLVDDKGQSNAVNPFITQADGSTYFNRWIDAENRLSDQNSWYDDKDEKTGRTVRRPSWQRVPRFAYEQSGKQFDSISGALDKLQNSGLMSMRELYDKAMSNIG